MTYAPKTKPLAARLKAEEVAEVLGFNDHDIPVLIAAKLLRPLGKPQQSCTKYFALCQIEELAQDASWLNKATQVLYEYWQNRNQRKKKAEKPHNPAIRSDEIGFDRKAGSAAQSAGLVPLPRGAS